MVTGSSTWTSSESWWAFDNLLGHFLLRTCSQTPFKKDWEIQKNIFIGTITENIGTFPVLPFNNQALKEADHNQPPSSQTTVQLQVWRFQKGASHSSHLHLSILAPVLDIATSLFDILRASNCIIADLLASGALLGIIGPTSDVCAVLDCLGQFPSKGLGKKQCKQTPGQCAKSDILNIL